MRCDTCRYIVKKDCEWRQGRCPHAPPMIDITKAIAWVTQILRKK